MAKVSSSAMWSATGMANVQASAIPAYLKDKGLYDGSAFITTQMRVPSIRKPRFRIPIFARKAYCFWISQSPVPRRDGKRRYRSWCIFRQQNR